MYQLKPWANSFSVWSAAEWHLPGDIPMVTFDEVIIAAHVSHP